MVRFGLPTQPFEARRAGYLQEKWTFGPQWLRISPFGQKEKRAFKKKKEDEVNTV